jgi:hypothetical protein
MAITVFNNICYRTDGKQMSSQNIKTATYIELLHYLKVGIADCDNPGYETTTYKCFDYASTNQKTRYYTTDKMYADTNTQLDIQCVNYKLGATNNPIDIDIPMDMYTMHQYKQYFYIYAYYTDTAVQGPGQSAEHKQYLKCTQWKSTMNNNFYLGVANGSTKVYPDTYCSDYNAGNEKLTDNSYSTLQAIFNIVPSSEPEAYYGLANMLYTSSNIDYGAKVLEFKFELEPKLHFMLHDEDLSSTENIKTSFRLIIGTQPSNFLITNIHSGTYKYNTDCTIKYPVGDFLSDSTPISFNFSNYHIKNGDTSTCKISIKNNEYPDASLTKDSGTIKITDASICYTKYPRLVTQYKYKSEDGEYTSYSPWYNNKPGQTFAIGQDCSFSVDVYYHAIYDTTALDFSSDNNARKAGKTTNIPQIGDIGYNSNITYTITHKYDKDNKEITITGSKLLKDATLGPGETIICDLSINTKDSNVPYRTFVKPMISYQLLNDASKNSVDYMNNFFCIDGKIPETGFQLLPLLNSMSNNMRSLSFLQDVHPTNNEFTPGKNPLLYNVYNGTFVGHLSSGNPNSNGVKTGGEPPYYDVCLDYSQLVLDASEGVSTIEGTKNLSMDHMPTKYDDVIKKNKEIKDAEKTSSTTTPTTNPSTGPDSSGIDPTDPTQTLTPETDATSS